MAKSSSHQDWSSNISFLLIGDLGSSSEPSYHGRKWLIWCGVRPWAWILSPLCQKGLLRGRAREWLQGPHPNETPHILLSRHPRFHFGVTRSESQKATLLLVSANALSYVIAWFRNIKACGGFGVRGVSWHMMMQSCDSTRSRCEPARMAFTDLWEGRFPLGSVPAGLTVRFQAAGKHILLHSHSGRGIVIFLFFSRVPADAGCLMAVCQPSDNSCLISRGSPNALRHVYWWLCFLAKSKPFSSAVELLPRAKASQMQ